MIIDSKVHEIVTLANATDTTDIKHAELTFVEITAVTPKPALGWLFDGTEIVAVRIEEPSR